jgi:hypothetical protein
VTVDVDPAPGIGPRDTSRRGDWLQMPGGRRFYPLDPRPAEVHIADVARSLSRTPRWRGMSDRVIWVAQHCVLVSELCPDEHALWGLLHDGPECIVCDLPSPLKSDPSMAPYVRADRAIMHAFCDRFGLPRARPACVAAADRVVLATEARDLFDAVDPEWDRRWLRDAPKLPDPVVPWSSAEAEARFLARFNRLYSGDQSCPASG